MLNLSLVRRMPRLATRANVSNSSAGILEPQQRLDINYTGLTFNFNNVSVSFIALWSLCHAVGKNFLALRLLRSAWTLCDA